MGPHRENREKSGNHDKNRENSGKFGKIREITYSCGTKCVYNSNVRIELLDACICHKRVKSDLTPVRRKKMENHGKIREIMGNHGKFLEMFRENILQ